MDNSNKFYIGDDPYYSNEEFDGIIDDVTIWYKALSSEEILKLYEKYPNDKEGSLDKKLASLVNKKKCLEVANSISLKEFILVGNPKKSEYIEDKIVSDACESLIGAIYLDRGLDVATKFILNLWNKHIDLSGEAYIDPKTSFRNFL